MPRPDALHVSSTALPAAFAALTSWALVRVGFHADSRIALGVMLVSTAVTFGVVRRRTPDAAELSPAQWRACRRFARVGFLLVATASLLGALQDATGIPLWKAGLACALTAGIATASWRRPGLSHMIVLLAAGYAIATRRSTWAMAPALTLLLPIAPFPAARLMHDARIQWSRPMLGTVVVTALWLLVRAWLVIPCLLVGLVFESVEDDPPPVTWLSHAARVATVLAWGVAAWEALHGRGPLGGFLH